MKLTLDANVIINWFFKTPLQNASDELTKYPYQYYAPDLLVSEYTNIIRKYVWNDMISISKGMELIDLFKSTPIHFVSSNELIDIAFKTANELNHSAYDCFYLAVPLTKGGIMITGDKKFYNKVIKSPYKDIIAWIENPPPIGNNDNFESID